MQKKKKLYYVVYFKDKTIKTLVDGIRLFADPYQKHEAHLTVRGPYVNIQRRLLEDWNKSLEVSKMRIKGAGTFFSASQNTVFLKCDAYDLKKNNVWFKKDFKDEFNPHITLYNGGDREFALSLLEILNSYDFDFSIESNELKELRSPILKRGAYNVFEEPFVSFYLDQKYLDQLLNGEMAHSVKDISLNLRLHYIKTLAALLHDYTTRDLQLPKTSSFCHMKASELSSQRIHS